MNRKQWFILGIGLIILSFFISIVAGMFDCTKLDKSYFELIEKGENPDSAWNISCHNAAVNQSLVSTIIFTLGILFVICGFLEPKTTKK